MILNCFLNWEAAVS